MEYTKEAFNFFKLFLPLFLGIVLILFCVGTLYNFMSCGINDILDLSTCSAMKEIFYERQKAGLNDFLSFSVTYAAISLVIFILTAVFDLLVFISKCLNLKLDKLRLWKSDWGFHTTFRFSEKFKKVIMIILALAIIVFIGLIIYITTFTNLCL
jgi:hypothetical protein